MKELALYVAWPSFLVAGVIEMLVFAVFDPQDIHGLGGAAAELSRGAVYSLGFFSFWLLTALASSLSLYLARPQFEVSGSSVVHGI